MPEPRTVLAVDFGLRRIGIAVGDTLTGRARPLGAVLVPADRAPGDIEIAAIVQLAADRGAALLVVGCPYNADGSVGPLTAQARAFADALGAQARLETHLVDERYSSLEAQERLRDARQLERRRRRVAAADIDSMAAAVILERWLAGEGER